MNETKQIKNEHQINKSKELYKEAIKHLVGGVNSPARSFNKVNYDPIYFKEGYGAIIIDEDNNRYIDYVLAWGTMILGHSNEYIVNELKNQLNKGIHFGACHYYEIEFAKLIKEGFKSIEKLRVVNSGTEAVLSAIRLAKNYTKRKKILKFEGNYHGHVDSLLVKGGSSILTQELNIKEQETIVCEYNNKEEVELAFNKYGEEIAAVIVEPVAGNMGVVKPTNGFLKFLREITKKYQAILIFDEVITGFRFCFGGLSNEYDPDLIILGKIVGGGLPIGVYGGKSYIMDELAPLGQTFQAGTFSGNPITMLSGILTLNILKSKNYSYLEELGEILENGIKTIKSKYNVDIFFNRYKSMWTLFFNNSNEIRNYKDVIKSDTGKYADFFRFLIKNGIYLPPSQFEAAFLSFEHNMSLISKTLDIIEEYFKKYS
jgi:glutamate-1-semialdehyde 2,1-aminomutase